jgi:hypothetical protein
MSALEENFVRAKLKTVTLCPANSILPFAAAEIENCPSHCARHITIDRVIAAGLVALRRFRGQ